MKGFFLCFSIFPVKGYSCGAISNDSKEAKPKNTLLGTSKNSLLMLNQRDFADSKEAKPKHTLLYGKALLTVVNGGAKRAIHYKSCRKAEPLLGNKIAIQRGIGIFRGALLYSSASLLCHHGHRGHRENLADLISGQSANPQGFELPSRYISVR